MAQHNTTIPPIHSLPPEVLSKIFEITIGDFRPYWGPEPYQCHPNPYQVRRRLSTVCQLWRELIFGDANVWNIIHAPAIDQDSLQHFLRTLKLSKQAPLDVYLNLSRYSTHQEISRDFLLPIVAAVGRLRTLVVSTSSPEAIRCIFPSHTRSECPVLQTLRIESHLQNYGSLFRFGFSNTPPTFTIDAPNLSELILDECSSYVFQALTPRSLAKILSLALEPLGPSSSFLTLINSCSNIVELGWTECAEDDRMLAVPNVTLQSLKKFDFSQYYPSGQFILGLLGKLQMPQLQYLFLRRSQDTQDISLETIPLLLSGNDFILKELYLRGVHFFDGDIANLATCMKGLRHLQFDDCVFSNGTVTLERLWKTGLDEELCFPALLRLILARSVPPFYFPNLVKLMESRITRDEDLHPNDIPGKTVALLDISYEWIAERSLRPALDQYERSCVYDPKQKEELLKNGRISYE